MQTGFASTSEYPQWWLDRGVINSSTNAVANDFATASQGQLKWMATQCAKEVDVRLPDGAGSAIWSSVNSFSLTNNSAALTIGQLKQAVLPFYERLWTEYADTYPSGFSGRYPWSFPEGILNDHALANIGQLKYVFSFDFDAAGLSTSETVTVSGTVTYAGAQTGDVVVVASTTSNGWGQAYSSVLSVPGAYSISGLPESRSYWIRAFRDADASGDGNGTEPWGNYVSNPFAPTSDVSNVDITLADATNSDDQLDDWWELQYFGNLSQTDTDSDGDGLINSLEYAYGTDPTKKDTDGDGIEDGVENLTNPAIRDSDADGLHDGIEDYLSNSTNSGVLIRVPYNGWYHAIDPDLKLIPLGE